MPSTRTLALVLGGGRAALGLALLLVPDAVTPRWVGEAGRSDAGRALARGLGVRDVVIGAGVAAGGGRSWVSGAGAADLGDLVATAVAPGLPRGGRIGTAALAGGSVVLHAWLVRALD